MRNEAVFSRRLSVAAAASEAGAAAAVALAAEAADAAAAEQKRNHLSMTESGTTPGRRGGALPADQLAITRDR